MPRPPLLPVLDWKALFKKGKTYKAWLAAAETKEQRERFDDATASFSLDPPARAWLGALPRTIHVAVIAECWCGDVVRHVPVLEAMAGASTRVKVRYFGRTDVPEVFVRFLTNGGEAIPKFVFLSDKYVECGHWGPMPEDCRELIARGKACGDIPAARKKVAALYDADPQRRTVLRELLHLIDIASSPAP